MPEFNFDSNVNTSFYTIEQLKTLCSAISELSSEKQSKLVVNNYLIDTAYTYKEVIHQPTSLDIENDQFTTITTCILNDLIYICLAQETSLPDAYPLLKKSILTCFGDMSYEFRIFKNNTASHVYNLNLMSHKNSFMMLSFLILDDINQKATIILKDIMYDEWKTFDVPFETVGSSDNCFYMLVSVLVKELIVYTGSVKTLNDLGISYDGLSGIDDEHLKLIEMLFI
jgi:hypothetical protein